MDLLDGLLGSSAEPAQAEPHPATTPARGGGLLDDLLSLVTEEEPLDAPGDVDPVTGKRPVGDSKDLRRVLRIPRRPPYKLENKRENPALAAARDRLHQALALPGCDRRLRDIQVWALTEICQRGGGLAPIGVGHGKTLIDILLPMVMPGCAHAVLLIPPNMRAPFFREWRNETRRWRVPNLAGGSEFVPGRPCLTVVAYSELSLAKNSDLLERLAPDLIVADEAHKLKDRKSSCTKRFLRYLHERPSTRVVCLSGTLTSRSLREYAHLSGACLGESSPLPLAWPTLEEWSSALDAPGKRGYPAAPGHLRRLCTGVESAREGFRRRLVETPGVVSTTEGSLGTTLIIRERPVKLPPGLEARLEEMRGDEDGEEKGNWQRPDGEELVTAAQLAESAKEVAAGFYLFWKYPRGEPLELIEEWREKRKAWHKELRVRLAHPAPHMDSELLCTNAAIRWHDGYKWVDPKTGETHHEPPHSRRGPYPVWDSETWPAWRAIRDQVKHVPGEKWLDDFLAKDAAEWAQKHVGLVWVHNNILGRRISELSGAPYYEGGEKASKALVEESGKRSVVVSIPAHHASKNLQQFSRNLVVQSPSSGRIWEQMIGRTHRQGQEAEEVVVEVYRHTKEYREAFEQAQRDSEYVEETTPNEHKLRFADVEW
jgi:hypothetical protein